MNYLDIVLPGSDDNVHSLRDFNGKKIVLYFYPKNNTPGCNLEAKDFTYLKSEYSKKGYMVIGVSRDTVKSHKNFIDKKELDLLLLSDFEEKLSIAFDVIKEKLNFGKKYIGLVRSTFILDENGKIIKEYRKVSAKNHAQEVLDYL